MAAGGFQPPPNFVVPKEVPLKLTDLTASDLEHIKKQHKAYLGSGFFAHVYKYGDFAIKIANDYEKSPEMLKKEYKIYELLRDTESFPKIESCGEGYLIMEKLEKTLYDLIKFNSLGEYKKVYFYHMVNAVKKCHEKSICHHDIKKDNFMKQKYPSHQIKLLDFGLSHKFGQRMPKIDPKINTEIVDFILPPEILEDFNCNGEHDIFMLGRCLFEIESGKPPFENTHNDRWWTTFKEDKEQFWEWHERINFNPSQEFKELFKGMMNPNPNQRFNINHVIASDYYKSCFKDYKSRVEDMSKRSIGVAVGTPAASPFKRYKKRKSNKHLRVQRISRKKASVSRKSKCGSARTRRSLTRGPAHSQQRRHL